MNDAEMFRGKKGQGVCNLPGELANEVQADSSKVCVSD